MKISEELKYRKHLHHNVHHYKLKPNLTHSLLFHNILLVLLISVIALSFLALTSRAEITGAAYHREESVEPTKQTEEVTPSLRVLSKEEYEELMHTEK